MESASGKAAGKRFSGPPARALNFSLPRSGRENRLFFSLSRGAGGEKSFSQTSLSGGAGEKVRAKREPEGADRANRSTNRAPRAFPARAPSAARTSRLLHRGAGERSTHSFLSRAAGEKACAERRPQGADRPSTRYLSPDAEHATTAPRPTTPTPRSEPTRLPPSSPTESSTPGNS